MEYKIQREMCAQAVPFHHWEQNSKRKILCCSTKYPESKLFRKAELKGELCLQLGRSPPSISVQSYPSSLQPQRAIPSLHVSSFLWGFLSTKVSQPEDRSCPSHPLRTVCQPYKGWHFSVSSLEACFPALGLKAAEKRSPKEAAVHVY